MVAMVPGWSFRPIVSERSTEDMERLLELGIDGLGRDTEEFGHFCIGAPLLFDLDEDLAATIGERVEGALVENK